MRPGTYLPSKGVSRGGHITLATKGMLFGLPGVAIVYIGTLVGLFCGEEAKHFPGILVFTAKLDEELTAEAKLEKSLVTEGKLEECP